MIKALPDKLKFHYQVLLIRISTRNIFINSWVLCCNVCWTVYGDLLVVMLSDRDKQTKVVRFYGSEEKQIIQFDDKGLPLYSSYGDKFICENRNLQVCVSDCYARTEVVVSQAGKPLFTYTGNLFTSNK